MKNSINAGSSLPLKMTGVSLVEFRLDVIGYVPGSTVPVFKASTDPDDFFTETVAVLEDTAGLCIIPASVTKDLSGQILRIERRYTNRSTGFCQVFTRDFQVNPAVIGERPTGITETVSPAGPIVIEDKIYTTLTAYEDAVAQGYGGTEEQWMALLRTYGYLGEGFPRLELKLDMARLYYRINNFAYLPEDQREGFYIAIQRYTTKGNKNVRKWTTVDDHCSTFTFAEEGDSIDYEDPTIKWTDQAIYPWPADLSELDVWKEIPYLPHDIINRFVYARDHDVLLGLDNTLRKPDQLKYIKISGTKGKRIKATKIPYRYRMHLRLVIYKDLSYTLVGDTLKKRKKRVFGVPVPFSVFILVYGSSVYKKFELR